MSLRMTAVGTYMRATRRSAFATEAAGTAFLEATKRSCKPPRRVNRRCTVTSSSVGGRAVYLLTPRTASSTVSIVYVHGGAFVSEIQSEHWDFVTRLVVETGAAVHVPIYGLAPDHHAAEAVAMIVEVIRRCTEQGPTYVMGDSAGGGLALSAAQVWRDTAGVAPLGLTLISPWLDVSLRNPAIADVERRDPWLARAGLRVCGRAWAGSLELDDPRVSPIYGDFDGLPSIEIYVGDRDLIVADCRLLRDRLPPDRLSLYEQPGGIHVYPLLRTPEGRAARRRLIARVRSVLSRPRPSQPQP